MDSQSGSKLNQILLQWPKGVVAPTSWLSELGISRQLLDRYEQSSWVTRVAKGAVIRKGDSPTWQGIVFALQSLLKFDISIGGRSALQAKGLDHFLAMNSIPTVRLFSPDVARLPKWVAAFDHLADFEFRQTNLLTENAKSIGFSNIESAGLDLKFSSPERAIMELLDTVPNKQTFEEAALIFENLTTLRPQVVQQLLENCSSIKVKRLFLYLAERNSLPWFTDLTPSKIELGKGKRSIVPHGELNQKYQIVVPRVL